VGIVNALHSADHGTLGLLLGELKEQAEPWMWWAANWKSLIYKTAHRLEQYQHDGLEDRKGRLVEEAEGVILPALRVEVSSQQPV
jgi:hypothetical protein